MGLQVAGRLELRDSYSNTIVYNNFVFPDSTRNNGRLLSNQPKGFWMLEACTRNWLLHTGS